ncbi:MAG: YceI family protein [Phycisphaeraceae bacterium]|nr:YceI family protein [Phycisphaeraceae bacterium]
MTSQRWRKSRAKGMAAAMILAAVAAGSWVWTQGAFAGATAAGPVYELDPTHTSVYFRIEHLGMSLVYGRFNEVSGQVQMGENGQEPAGLQVIVPSKSVDTGVVKRDQHLRTGDFFDVEKFPQISFTSTTLKPVEEEPGTFELTGQLSLHGVTKPLTVKLKKMGQSQDSKGNQRIGLVTEFQIQRSAYGMDKMIEAVGDKVELMVSMEAVKKP